MEDLNTVNLIELSGEMDEDLRSMALADPSKTHAVVYFASDVPEGWDCELVTGFVTAMNVVEELAKKQISTRIVNLTNYW